MKKVNLVLIALVLAAGLLVIEIIIIRKAVDFEPQIEVIYARKKIPAKTEVTQDMLEKRKVGISYAHSQSVKDERYAAGKRTRADIEEGEMILSSRLGWTDEMEEIKVEDKNNRLYTVEFKADQANGWWLMVGQRVDIIFVPNEKTRAPAAKQVLPQASSPASGNNKKDIEDRLEGEELDVKIQRLKNIRVAAIFDEQGKPMDNSKRAVMPKYVSFEVNDKQDELLAYGKSNGRLELSVIPSK